ncbi:MAG: hypothetical protein K2N09_08995 [Muribaculaceae bacterium]|nr:hypothetical protein [Muribaculaceae bacterium]
MGTYTQTYPDRDRMEHLTDKDLFFSNFSYLQATARKKSMIKINVAIARNVIVAVGT